MTIAFVVAVFNGGRTLDRTLDSLAMQAQRPYQVIVMDGGSTDGTQAILACRGDVVTYWHSARDTGIYDAWNKALAHVTADWVAFLGADDYLVDNTVLERLAVAAEVAPADTAFVYGRLHEVDAAGQVLSVQGRPWAQSQARFPFEMTLPHPGMLHRRSLCFANSGFDASYRIAGDYALLRPLLLRCPPLFVDFAVAAAREGGVSTHPNRRVQSVLEVGRAIRAGGGAPPLRWHLTLLKNRLRRWIWRLFGDAGLQWARGLVRAMRGSATR